MVFILVSQTSVGVTGSMKAVPSKALINTASPSKRHVCRVVFLSMSKSIAAFAGLLFLCRYCCQLVTIARGQRMRASGLSTPKLTINE